MFFDQHWSGQDQHRVQAGGLRSTTASAVHIDA